MKVDRYGNNQEEKYEMNRNLLRTNSWILSIGDIRKNCKGNQEEESHDNIIPIK